MALYSWGPGVTLVELSPERSLYLPARPLQDRGSLAGLRSFFFYAGLIMRRIGKAARGGENVRRRWFGGRRSRGLGGGAGLRGVGTLELIIGVLVVIIVIIFLLQLLD